MKTLLTILALVLTVVVWSGSARAEEAPAAPATGAGIKALPGTVQKDVTDAVKHDLGAAVGAPAANAPAKGAPAGGGAASDDEDDEDAED